MTSASSSMDFKSGLSILHPLHASVGVSPVTTRLLGRFDLSSTDTSSSQIMAMSCVMCL